MSLMDHNVFTEPTRTEDGVWRFMGLEVEVILASMFKGGAPLFTIRMRYPRIIHGEVMTHRVFNRNARSSRAVPVMTMLAELRSGTLAGLFTPWHWGKNQSGMQASEENNTAVTMGDVRFNPGTQQLEFCEGDHTREEAWSMAAWNACEEAEAFHNAGYHKQVVNRLIEPFSYIDVLVTATDWANFLHLRDHADAEPHLRDLARLIKLAMDDADVRVLEPGQWHLPYITGDDIDHAMDISDSRDIFNEWLCKISSARCARISYKPFDGNASYDKELERYEMLVGNGAVHATPLEHQATPDTKSWQETVRIEGNVTTALKAGNDWDNPHLHGNLRGWIQNRKLVPNECVYDA